MAQQQVSAVRVRTVTNFSRSDLSWKRLLGGVEQVRGVVAILSITLGFAIFCDDFFMFFKVKSYHFRWGEIFLEVVDLLHVGD